MNTPSEMNVDWNSVNLDFTPSCRGTDSGGSAILTFLAWGDNGSTTNLPPTVFLEGVNTTPVVPEPATLVAAWCRPPGPRRDHAATARQKRRRNLITRSVDAPGRDLVPPGREHRTACEPPNQDSAFACISRPPASPRVPAEHDQARGVAAAARRGLPAAGKAVRAASDEKSSARASPATSASFSSAASSPACC